MENKQDLKELRRARRKAEMKRGRQQVHINAAWLLVAHIQNEIDTECKFKFTFLPHTDDPKNWGVRVDFNNGQAHAESWLVFPTDELKTKVMLFGGVPRNAHAGK